MDACGARHVHRNAAPKVTVSVFRPFCVKSPNASPGFGASSSRPRTSGPAAGVPPRRCGRIASHPLPRYPGHYAVVSPPCPAVPRPSAAAVAGSGWLGSWNGKTIKSCSLSATGSSRTAWVAARSSPARGARRPRRAAAPRPAQRGWAVSPKLASLHHLSFGLRKKRKLSFLSTVRPGTSVFRQLRGAWGI